MICNRFQSASRRAVSHHRTIGLVPPATLFTRLVPTRRLLAIQYGPVDGIANTSNGADPGKSISLAVSDEYLSAATPLPPVDHPLDFHALRRDYDIGGVLILETGVPGGHAEVTDDLIAACSLANIPICRWPASTANNFHNGACRQTYMPCLAIR